jgi:glycosyltransferase involved in cell wall biosynthesis
MKRRGITGAVGCWASLPTALAVVGRKFFDTPYCMTARAWDIFVPMNQIGLDEKIACSSVVRTNNEASARFMRRFCRTEADARKLTCVYNPVDVSHLQARRGPRGGPCRIASGGSLTEQKGLEYLLEAVGKLREKELDCRVRIVGEGVLRRSLEERIARLGLGDRVELTGVLPNQAFLDLIRDSSCFVLPCVPASDGCMDGIPNVLIESMALGVPVISTTISGIPEIIEDGVTGLLVPPREPVALAEAIRRLVRDEALQRTIAENGRRRVEALFEMNRNACRLIEVYESAGLLGGEARQR